MRLLNAHKFNLKTGQPFFIILFLYKRNINFKNITYEKRN